jgi:hypothetical protein
MKKEELIRKLTSRKFWVAVAGLVSGIMIFRGASESDATQVTALILQAASVLAYCIGEGLADNGNGVMTISDTSGETKKE